MRPVASCPLVIAVTRCPMLMLSGSGCLNSFSEVWLVVEQINLTWCAGHEQEDDVFRSRRRCWAEAGHAVLRQQRSQCGDAQPHARGLQKLPPSLQSMMLFE